MDGPEPGKTTGGLFICHGGRGLEMDYHRTLMSQQWRVIVHKRSLSSALAFVGSEIEFAAADSLLTRLGASVAAAWRVERRRRSRQALRSLSRFEIQDFCPDLIEAEREAYKPFWRV
jgi:uncharacterized protein YjiS (DUF1127 family)